MSENIVADGIVEAGALKQYLGAMTPLVQEGRIHISEDGLESRVVDPANVAMCNPVTLSPQAFEAINTESSGRATVGISFTALEERLSKASGDDLVHLKVNMKTGHLVVEYGAVTHRIALIDPDTIRHEPDVPELDLPNTATVPGRVLSEAYDHVDMVADHIEVYCEPDEKQLRFVGEGDTDDVDLTYGEDDVIDAQMTESTMSKFSMDYFEELFAPIPESAEVTLTLGHEFPILIEWDAMDGALSVGQMCAPRIESK